MGAWRCEKCNSNFDNMNRRYILSMEISDPSGAHWVSMFNDTATKLLGCDADQLAAYKQEDNESAFEKAFTDAQWKSVIVKCRVKQESHNDELKTKVNVMALDEINYDTECNQMIDAIRKYN